MRRKISREEVKYLVHSGLSDEQIAYKMNCAVSTIISIRLHELNIRKKDVLYYLTKNRKLVWKNRKGKIDGGLIVLTMPFLRELYPDMNFPTKISYRIRIEHPNIVLELARVPTL
jgi:hypothetical protein